MQPVMELRKRYKEKFEKTHGVRLGFMSYGLLELFDDDVFEKLWSVLRASDELAKFGNSEFAILLRAVKNVDSVAKVAERIQNALTKPITIGRSQYSATASIGITLNESETESETKNGLDLLNRAIHSMKSAKEMGEARHVIHNAKTGLEKTRAAVQRALS